ncbi:MAG: VOC family protein [Rhodospirillaceae bacterium]|jgi:catechol 2,3-dioxygenase-like lactoylglutathione lyase family enzyme|nr:VOC family protein [Rhodospirillaceae bacterium]MBT6136666.1 VOC family protein [Rhodospirillaceae bacterium]
MIGYVTLGTNDYDRALEFYDALLGEIGSARVLSNDYITLWGNKAGGAMIGVIKPHDKQDASVGNGVMPAILVQDASTVARLHAKARELGGLDEGTPGPRGDNASSFAYVRDLDGNKLAFYCNWLT